MQDSLNLIIGQFRRHCEIISRKHKVVFSPFAAGLLDLAKTAVFTGAECTFTCEGEYSGGFQDRIAPPEQFFHCLYTGITVVQTRLKDCHLHLSKFIQRRKCIYRSEAIAH